MPIELIKDNEVIKKFIVIHDKDIKDIVNWKYKIKIKKLNH